MKKLFKRTEEAGNKFLKPAAPFIGMALSAKLKNPEIGAATGNILRSIAGEDFRSD